MLLLLAKCNYFIFRPALGPGSLLRPAVAPTLPCPGWELAGAFRRGGRRGWVVPGHLRGLHLLPSVTPQPLTRQHSLLQAASPSTDSKLRGKKYNTRDDSGWQINKLALITLRVSNLYFSHARQRWLLSRFGPTVLIPMPPHPRDPLAVW